MIPKHLHFIFGLAPKSSQYGNTTSANRIKIDPMREWGLVHYVCIRSAIERIRPSEVSFYLQNEPSGPWWDLTKPLVNIVRVDAPEEIFGRPLKHYAHKADVIRLEQLIKHGGIYLDADVFVHNSFDGLLENSVVMGKEGIGGLCNAVILAERDAPFLRAWYENYRSFDGAKWSYHSVVLPFELSQRSGLEVKILPETAFFWPTWKHKDIYQMFGAKNSSEIHGAYANHLWEQRARDYLAGLTPGHVRKVDTAFHAWARPYVAELSDQYGGGIDRRYLLRRDVFAKAKQFAHILRYAVLGR